MLFNQDFNALVIATKVTVAKNLVEKVRVMHDLLPVWLRDGGNSSVEDNKLSLKLKNGSQVKAIASSPDAGRSEALSLLVVDEAAFIRDIDEIWLSAQSTLSTGGSAVILSTPNGVGNFFHKTWVAGESGINGFNCINLHWTVHPERNQAWRDEQTRILGIKGAAQECDCDFIGSGDTVIEPALLTWYKDTYVMEPVEKRGFDGNLWVWEYANYNRQYMVVADVARGDGADYSTAQVIDIDDCSQVAEYKGKIDTKDFGNFLTSLATEYNNALLVVENSNVGWACIQQIIDRQYGNLFYMSNDLKYIDVEKQMSNKFYRDEKQMVAGFSTTSKTRPLIISALDTYMNEKDILIRSQRLIDELFTFIWTGGRAEAMKGYNDDLTMALAIGLWVRNTALRLRQEGIDLTKSMLSSTQIKQYDGVYSTGYTGKNPYEMDLGKGEVENLSWLLR
jgi:subtilisin family serine protease